MELEDKVVVWDFSEAHGDVGFIWCIQDNGIILVELEETGATWPVLGEKELKPWTTI